MTIAALAFAYSAFAFFCASMRRQYASLFNHWNKKPRTWLLKAIGSALLLTSLIQCILLWGNTVGFAVWWLVLAIPAYIVVLIYTYLPRHYLVITGGVLGMAVLSTAWSLL